MIYCEKILAELIGLSVKEIRAVRSSDLEKKVDWRMQQRQIVLTETGLSKLLLSLNLGPTTEGGRELQTRVHEAKVDEVPPPPPKGDDDKAPEKNGVVKLVVVRLWNNPRLLQCTDPDGRLVDCYVKLNRNFRRPMVLNARKLHREDVTYTGPDRYEQVGQPPKFPGRY